MGKLDQIPKKQIFNVPEGYFDKLPLKIQLRLDATRTESKRHTVRYALQYGLPLLLIGAILFFYVRPDTDASSILATVDTEDLIHYLEYSGLTTEDMLENVDFNGADLEAIENKVYDLELRDSTVDEIQLELNTL